MNQFIKNGHLLYFSWTTLIILILLGGWIPRSHGAELSHIQYELSPEIPPQGHTQTCFALSAFYSLQYFRNLLAPLGAPRPKPVSVSQIVTSLWGPRYLDQPGWTYAALHNLRKTPLRVGKEPPIEALFDFERNHSQFLESEMLEGYSRDWQTLLRDVMPFTELAQISTRVQEALSEIPLERRSTESLLNRILPYEQVPPPTYNVFVFEPTDELFALRRLTNARITQETWVMEEIERLLSPDPHSGISYPLEFSYCPSPRGEDCDFHSVSVIGIRPHELQVVDGLEYSTPVWVPASPLIQGFIHFKQAMSYIRPCEATCQPNRILGPFPLHYLVRAGDLESIRSLALNPGSEEIDRKNRSGFSPVYLAAEGGRVDILNYLISLGANFTSLQNGNTPLQIAADTQQLAVVEELLKHWRAHPETLTPELERRSDHNMTALYYAANRGYTPIVALLIKAGADFLSLQYFGFTPLHAAIQGGYSDTVQLLLEEAKTRGILRQVLHDPSTQDRTALDMAEASPNPEVRERVRQANGQGSFSLLSLFPFIPRWR